MPRPMTHGKMSQEYTPPNSLLTTNCGNCGISQQHSHRISQHQQKPLSLSQLLLDAGTTHI
jgi:hypothetical protein